MVQLDRLVQLVLQVPQVLQAQLEQLVQWVRRVPLVLQELLVQPVLLVHLVQTQQRCLIY